MSDAFWNNLPILIAALVAAILSLINGIRLTTIHRQINSRMDELLARTKTSSHAEGVEQERMRDHRKRK